MSARKNGFRWAAAVLVLVLAAAAALAYAVRSWLISPLPLRQSPVEVSIEPGTAAREVARRWVAAGVDVPEAVLYAWFRLSGDARSIRAGSYSIDAGTSPRLLLYKMVQGQETLEAVRLIEGWTMRQWRAALEAAPHIQHRTTAMSDAELMAAIGAPGVPPEGRFFPDTYRYSRGVSDLVILRRAYQDMRARLLEAWEQRAPELPLESADQALALASIIEKETGRSSDRGMIAGVFVNRLRLGMPLQTDPTVIYGLGEAFDGNLRKRDLLADTPYNTYTRRGLPPTPIAMPGAASLAAAVQPQSTKALYFVARGDGSSVFSDTLAEHNRAVNQYQRGGQP